MAKINDALLSNIFSKTHGGSRAGVVDTFTSGYFYTFFLDIPDVAAADPFSSVEDVRLFLTGNTLSMTPPSITLNKNTTQGAGGQKSSAASSIDVGDSISTRHKEYAGLPTSKLFSNWVRGIRDFSTGGTNIDNYSKTKYSCSVLYVITQPNWKTIERAMLFTGCFPDKDPIDSFDGDYSSFDEKEIDITWNVDRMFDSFVPEHASWLIEQAETNVGAMTEIINNYKSGRVWGGPASV